MVGLVLQELHKFILRFQAKFLYFRVTSSDCIYDAFIHSVVAQPLTSVFKAAASRLLLFSQSHCCWLNSFSVVFILLLALKSVLSMPFTYLVDGMEEGP